MAKKSINIDHSDSSLLSNDGSYIQINKNGSVKLGYGKNIDEGIVNNNNPETLAEYKGTLRFNATTKNLEFCNGTQWIPLMTEETGKDTNIIYSMIF